MPGFANTALRLLRRLLGAPSRIQGPYAGTATVLDGNTAVALTEAGFSDAAGLGASFPAEFADLAWRNEQWRQPVNQMGTPLGTHTAEGVRGALAASIGMAMSGLRATSFLSGTDLAQASDLLAVAAGHRLPLVIHVSTRALASHAPALGSGHESIHLAADSGCFQFMAANVQEAVDFSLIARRVAEQSLLPGLVSMDCEQTALALQEVRLLPAGLMKAYLGQPDDQIVSTTPAQQWLLGKERRRVPRWHNPDRPVMLGGLQATEVWGQAKAAGRVFFDDTLSTCLDDAFDQFAQQTGRHHWLLSSHRVEDASLILVAQGAVIETLEALSDYLRDNHRLKVGVLGIRCLRPFPGEEIVRHLSQCPRVCVLERLDVPLASDPPLLREVRAACDHGYENERFGTDTDAGYPAINAHQHPRFISVIYGLGGLPLRGADLLALCLNLDTIKQSRVYLGVKFSQLSSDYPKRQVLLDRLRRSYPGIADLGLRDEAASPELRPKDAITLVLHRLSGDAGEGLMVETALFLYRLLGGGLRSRPALFTKPWAGLCTDRLSFSSDGLRDPGDETPVDLAVLVSDAGMERLSPHLGLVKEGVLLVQSMLPDESVWAQLPAATRVHLKESGGRLYKLTPPEAAISTPNEYLLGAISGVLLKADQLDITQRRLVTIREEQLRQSVMNVDAALTSFEAGIKQVKEINCARFPLNPMRSSVTVVEQVPAMVRRLGNIDDAYDSLPRFWDQVGVLYKQGKSEQLAPDPYLAIGAVPPLSASFRDLSRFRKQHPLFNPALCTGCGDCWSRCPDSAIQALAISPARLIDAGIRLSSAEMLRPVASKLAAGIANQCLQQDPPPPTSVEPLLEHAYGRIKDRLPFPEERKQAIQHGVEQMVEEIGCLPVAITDPLYHDAEKLNKGSGELLVLAVDPEGCKGCGICIQACQSAALQNVRQSSQSLSQARQIERAWHGLPDSEPATLNRLERHPQVGAMAAVHLAHSAALAMTGGDGAEPGSGAKLAIRLVLAVVEAQLAPRFAEYLQQVNDTREAITGLIRTILSDALPADDMDALSRGLDNIDARQADMTSLLSEVETAVGSKVDAARLRRLVDLARDLSDLAWRLSTGRQGMGRARVSLVLSPGSAVGWASSFPHSPYSSPVTLDTTGDGAQLAAGLLEGQLRQATEGFVMMRKARTELEGSADAARLWSDLEALTWRDLDEQERSLCPAMLLVGDSDQLVGRGLGQLTRVLANKLPIKVLLLADLDLGLADRAGLDSPLSPVNDVGIDLALLTLTRRDLFVAQTSVSVPAHFTTSIRSAFAYPGPALMHLHAPSPTRHGFATDQTLHRAETAVTARLLPLFRYDPQAEGVLGSRITLDDNPDPLEQWVMDHEGRAITPADWVLGEARFTDCYSPLNEGDEGIGVVEYLAMSEQERNKRVPTVGQHVNGEQVTRVRVDERLLKVIEERQASWRMLQELAGLVTPFTARVQQQEQARVAAAHEADLKALADEYEQRIRELSSQLQQQTRQAMRDRLMQLAGYRDSTHRKSGSQ
ncbi:MAG: 4Fe-4S binding protein [Candidatus Thiodiazotropha sp. (ex Lucinoma borealis)]|nr:4Fe-4S binding protein [Candidatus Thiodiazotropha sp. (ex Lucinoma borealis)]